MRKSESKLIGILDSGVGGLSLARMISDFPGGYDFIYFGDTARGPYGNLSPVAIEKYALEGARFLVDNNAGLIVTACHDISCIAVAKILEKYPVHLIDAVRPSVMEALEVSRFSRIGVIGSRATIESGDYEKKIKQIRPEAKVYSNPGSLLVSLAEEGWYKKPETHMIVKKYVQPLKMRQIDTLIAGCSYYSYLNRILERKTGKRIKVVNCSTALAGYLKTCLENHSGLNQSLSRNNRRHFFVSDLTFHLQETAKIYYRRNLVLKAVTI